MKILPINQLLELYEPITRAVCRSMSLPADQVEDVVHDTFLAAYRSLPGYRQETKMSSWLWIIAQRQIVNLYRKRRTQKAHSVLPDSQDLSVSPDPFSTAVTREQREQLCLSLNKLPADWTKALRLYYWQHKNTHEIAMQLQIKPGTIRVILHRSRQRLREELERTEAA